MKKNKILLASIALFTTTFLLVGCEKDKEKLAAVENYKLVGKIDPSRTTITTTALIKAEFTVSYNSPNSFGLLAD